MLEENGYLESVGDGKFKNLQIALKLQNDDAYCINCAAAHLGYMEYRWDGFYDLSSDPVIWGSIYNYAENPPHPNPGPNSFGRKVSNI